MFKLNIISPGTYRHRRRSADMREIHLYILELNEREENKALIFASKQNPHSDRQAIPNPDSHTYQKISDILAINRKFTGPQ